MRHIRTVSNEEFVEVWQAANTLRAAAATLDVDRQQVNNRAAGLRRAGVRLKKFRAARIPINVPYLNKIIDDTENQQEADEETESGSPSVTLR